MNPGQARFGGGRDVTEPNERVIARPPGIVHNRQNCGWEGCSAETLRRRGEATNEVHIEILQAASPIRTYYQRLLRLGDSCVRGGVIDRLLSHFTLVFDEYEC